MLGSAAAIVGIGAFVRADKGKGPKQKKAAKQLLERSAEIRMEIAAKIQERLQSKENESFFDQEFEPMD